MAGNNAIPSSSAKPTRKRIRRTGKKPGKTSWIHGTKETFFTSRSDEWASAQRMGTAKLGKFYDDVTNLYIQKYGYDMKDEEDLEDVPDPTDPNAPDPDMGTLSKEEADRRSKISLRVRGDLLAGANMGATQPARMQTWQYYSKHHYEERVKARFEVAWKAELQRAKDLDQPEPHEVKVRGEVTRQAWDEESDEFKALVVAAQNKEYTQMLRAWEMGRAEESSHTAEELNATLKNAALYLQPLADSIQERFSMNVAIMLCGPIGEHGGAIEVRSVHSGTTAGLNPKKWYNFDPVGYQNAEASMVRFSEKTFSEAERERRRVASASSASNEDMPAGSTSSEGAVAGTHAGPSGARATVLSGGAGDSVERGGVSGLRQSPAPTPRALTPDGTPPPPPRDEAAPPPPPRDEAAPPPPPRDEAAAPPPPRETPALPRETPELEGTPAPVHEAWRRKDMAQWSEELRRAHSAFAMGANWPEDWARLVNEYIDFEAAAGYPDEGPRMGGDGRPSEVGEFLTGGRKWHSPPKIRKLGKLGDKGSYTDNWWMWWRSLQPAEREVVEETGMMTMPMEMAWGKLTKMSGRNGFLQVMASLFWWGLEEFRDGREDKSGWAAAVGDVEGILYGVLRSGEVQVSTWKKGAAGKKRKATDMEVEEGGRHSKRIAGGKSGETSGRETRGAAGKTAVRPKPRPVRKAK
ncbi:hypothetical protein C8F04DRAFT_1272732 [Mycena alexandri]|uniref:Uncharacterized protein n=1 Tax=Mycena alexandri TaxID=1745969 RepID=A0AAD6S710_9AGAR|nr:hypothetical protein C8F04DRAFT_1272732 [Mycena alexandri]